MSTAGNYFELFGLPVDHLIDKGRLDAEYERLSLETHPDFFSNAPSEEQQTALNRSAEVNEAYRVLSHESRRATYLLGLLAQTAQGGVELNKTALPDGFLQEMFALQEELEDFDPAADNGRAKELREQIGGRLADVVTKRGKLFAVARDQANDNNQWNTLQAIQTNLNCEKYLLRLMDRLD